MVSAVCPNCTIYLVEANSENSDDLEAAEAQAVKLGAHVVSNSWICYSYSCSIDPSYFDTPGVIYTAGSGDEGYNIIGPPMSLPTVTAVGGTVLSKSGSNYSEDVWDGAGSGCAQQVTNRNGSTIRAARIAPVPTSRPSPTTFPSTTRTTQAAGSPSAARASQRR